MSADGASKVPGWRIAAASVAMCIVFVLSWLLWQWAWWMVGGFYDGISPIFGPRGYDPNDIGFLQQLFRDLVPAGAAMATAAWAASKYFRGAQLGYRLGASVILVGLAASAVFVTWSMVEGNPDITWRGITLQWATVIVVAFIARWADKEI